MAEKGPKLVAGLPHVCISLYQIIVHLLIYTYIVTCLVACWAGKCQHMS